MMWVYKVPTHSRGFSLIEMVVATTVLGFSLVAAYEVFGTGLRGAATAETQAKSLVVLDGLTAQLGSVYPLDDGVLTGEASGGLSWRIQITPYTEDTLEPGRRLDLPDTDTPLKRVRIEVSNPAGPVLDVTTLRLKEQCCEP